MGVWCPRLRPCEDGSSERVMMQKTGVSSSMFLGGLKLGLGFAVVRCAVSGSSDVCVCCGLA